MSLFDELKRRNVFRVVAAYVVLSWLLLQIGDVVFGFLEVPDWAGKLLLAFIALGFIPAVVFSWAYELTPEGIKKESQVDRTKSVTPETGRKLDLITIGMIVFAIGFALVDRLVLRPSSGPSVVESKGLPTVPPEGVVSDPSQAKDANSNERKSIAVLPFASFSDDPADAYFASGVHEDILTHLARIAELRVISRSSVIQYGEDRPAIAVIADALNVGHVLEGSVRRAGNKVRVTAQLIDASTDEHLWAENFDRDLTDVFAIQTEIAKAIAAAMQANLTPDEDRLISQAPTENLEAYDLYVRARQMLQKPEYSLEKYLNAEPLLERALELDPGFALAHAMIADIHGQAVWSGSQNTPERRAAMKQAVDRALSLAPDLPEAQAALAEYYYRVERDYAKAIVELEAAYKRLPSNGEILYKMGMSYRRLGRWDESIDSFEQALRVDPANHYLAIGLGNTLLILRRWDDVLEFVEPLIREFPNESDFAAMKGWALLNGYGRIDEAKSVMAGRPPSQAYFVVILKLVLPRYERDLEAGLAVLNEPDIKAVDIGGAKDLFRAHLYQSVGEFDQAREYFERSRDEALQAIENGRREFWLLSILAESHAFLGENEAALEVARESLALVTEQQDQVAIPGTRSTYALVLAQIGKTEQALDELAALVALDTGVSRWALTLDPRWDVLRDNPRFAEIARVETVVGD